MVREVMMTHAGTVQGGKTVKKREWKALAKGLEAALAKQKEAFSSSTPAWAVGRDGKALFSMGRPTSMVLGGAVLRLTWQAPVPKACEVESFDYLLGTMRRVSLDATASVVAGDTLTVATDLTLRGSIGPDEEG